MRCLRTIVILGICISLTLEVAKGSLSLSIVKCSELQPCTTDTPGNECRDYDGQAYKLIKVFEVIGCSSYESTDHAICEGDETTSQPCATWELFNDANCMQSDGNAVVEIDKPVDGSTPCDSIGIFV